MDVFFLCCNKEKNEIYSRLGVFLLKKWGEMAKFSFPFEIPLVVPRRAADKECSRRQR